MSERLVKSIETGRPTVAGQNFQKRGAALSSPDNDAETSKLQSMANASPQVQQLKAYQDMANTGPRTRQLSAYQHMADNYTPGTLQRKEASNSETKQPAQNKANQTGLPDNLKAGVENLSGLSMDDVKVHYNSPQPAQLQAHAYAQGTIIHIAPGQEKHLPHEAWHVVQQKKGRVQPTIQIKGAVPVNDDKGLEHEADVMGAKALGSQGARDVTTTSVVSGGVKQLKDKEDNPYRQGEFGLSAHHIIPQSVLTNVLGQLHKDKQIEVMAKALPDFAGLTINTLVNANITTPTGGNSFTMKYKDAAMTNYKLENDMAVKAIAKTKFGDMPAQEQDLLTFDGNTWDEFNTLYTQLKAATTEQNVTVLTAVAEDDQERTQSKIKEAKIKDMYAAFYQWQSGNLFYGSERYEEDSKDTLDEDEKYSNTDKDFSKKIKDIYTVLKANEKALTLTPEAIKAKLNELTALTKNRAVAAYDARIFKMINTTDELAIMKVIGMRNRIGLDRTGSSIHKQAIRDKIKVFSAHPLLSTMERKAATCNINSSTVFNFKYKTDGVNTTISVGAFSSEPIIKDGRRYKLTQVEQPAKDLLTQAMGV